MRSLSMLALGLVGCVTPSEKPDDICFGTTCGEPEASDEAPVDTELPTFVPQDTGTPPEVCNGVDDDGDGEIDEDPVDGFIYYADNDGDGFGDPDNEIRACEPRAGLVLDTSDCDDENARVNPLAADVSNGQDDDCDGRVDEVDVAFIAAHQCTSDANRAAATDLEVAQVSAFLGELGLTVERIDAEPGGSIPTTLDLRDYSLIFYTKCGWAWSEGNRGDADVITHAMTGEVSLFMFGDDLAYRMDTVPAAEALVMLAPTQDNGTGLGGILLDFDDSSSHPTLDGPYGRPVDYSYAWDMDRTSLSTQDAIVLGTHGRYSTPVLAAWEHPVTQQRKVSLLASVYNANHGSPGSEARVNGEILFKNIVTWLLRL